MSHTEFLEKGIEIVTKAIEADNNKSYEDAFNLYSNALMYFLKALKYETNPKSKQLIQAKTTEYMYRAEKLKEHLDKNGNNNNSNNSNDSTNGTAGKLKSKSNQNDDEADNETKKMRGALSGAILSTKPNVRWEDIAGLDTAKEALKEAVILPIKFPHLFTGKRRPWSGILLYGPPGTGKSYLAKAVATEANSTFFSISSSDLVSKWMGESEKLIKQLFTMARENAPSIIFIDEVDSLCSSRTDGESDPSRRMKNELLIQMSAVASDATAFNDTPVNDNKNDSDIDSNANSNSNLNSSRILVLGATNLPWQLDAGVRRRFERRIYIPLPDLAARTRMFQLNVGNTPCNISAQDYRQLAEMTEGYSGHDVAVVVRDALMEPIRKIQTATHFKPVKTGTSVKYTPCSPGDANAKEMTWMELDQESLAEPPLSFKDFLKAISNTHPSVNRDDIVKQEEFTKEFGLEGN